MLIFAAVASLSLAEFPLLTSHAQDQCGPACVKSSGPSAESCCGDDQGWVCCIKQNTRCIQKDPAIPTVPSRCCPRWTVGCTAGRVGCCDPAQPWQWNLADRKIRNSTKTNAGKHRTSSVNGTAFALFNESPTFGKAGLRVAHVSLSTGQIEKSMLVTGFENLFGESTRKFVWDGGRKQFYYLDANWTSNMGERPSGGRTMLLYSVDATTGEATRAEVKGAKDYPTGMAMHEESGNLVIAAQQFEKDSSNSTDFTGYIFYSLDPTTATAKPLGSLSRGKAESDDAFYSGFHTTTNAAGTAMYRLGYKLVKTQQTSGLGITSIGANANAPRAVASKWNVIAPLSGHDFYMSMCRLDDGSFVSLAPSTAGATRELDLVKWSAPSSTSNAAPVVVAKLGDAHPPRTIGGGDLGYMADAAKGTTYAALVVDDGTGGGPYDKKDRWAISVVDLETGSAATLPLLPKDLAGEWSAAGLGL